jgi:GMP synthase (glutamine-hydrolysing)
VSTEALAPRLRTADRAVAYNRPRAAGRELIVVVDFGSQYSLLIARRIRECGVYCELVPHDLPAGELARMSPRGIVLSGGPSSVHDADAPRLAPELLSLGVPVLGICYGAQLLALASGGSVQRASAREFGRAKICPQVPDRLLDGLAAREPAWMSHGDAIGEVGPRLEVIARSDNGSIAAFRGPGPCYGIQFHPEVKHTPAGAAILSRFARDICGCTERWSADSFVDETIAWIADRVGGGRAICALSGGVDSGVAATLAHHAIGDRLTCVFIDHGLLRAREAAECRQVFAEHLQMDVRFVDAADRFLTALKGAVDPEEKRRRIGAAFVGVFEEAAASLGQATAFVQGTTYPDVVESAGDSTRHTSAAAKIKTHHNVGGLPETMKLDLLDPLSFLFKDEVRAVGRRLGLPEEIIQRHPFPGPGLAVRIIGEVTPERAGTLRLADDIFISELRRQNLYSTVSQALCVLTPVKTVGVMGDARTYEDLVALRAVTTEDWMTADWARLPADFLALVASRIVNEVPGVNRVVYDITSKPPATVEWE